MYFYYFRETAKSDGYGNIIVARILSFGEPVMDTVSRPCLKRWYFPIVVDPEEFELPNKKNRSRKFKSNPDYNRIWMPIEEGEIRNRTFWLREYDLERAHQLVNDYYKEITQENSRIYSKRMNSKIKVVN